MIATSQVDPAGHLISKIIPFSKDLSFERLRPITDLRKDDGEARVLYICRKVFTSPESGTDKREYVMKIKIQVPKPGGIAEALPGPSDITKAELQALELFKKAEIPNLPRLEAWTGQVQGPDGLLPGGYISFTVMNLLPGSTIWDLNFWGLPAEERDEIRALALKVLHSVLLAIC